jgi:hypothetical protein
MTYNNGDQLVDTGDVGLSYQPVYTVVGTMPNGRIALAYRATDTTGPYQLTHFSEKFLDACFKPYSPRYEVGKTYLIAISGTTTADFRVYEVDDTYAYGVAENSDGAKIPASRAHIGYSLIVQEVTE